MLKELEILHKKNPNKCPKLEDSYIYLGYKLVFKKNKLKKIYDVSLDYQDVSYFIKIIDTNINEFLRTQRILQLHNEAESTGKTISFLQEKLNEINNKILKLV